MTRIFAAAGICLSLLGATTASGAPIALDFQPPALPPQMLCVAAEADEAVVARWTAWDEGASNELPAKVLADARRIRDLDPVGTFPLVLKMLDAGEASAPPEDREDYLIDRINLYLKAGRTADLTEAGLVDMLVAQAELSTKGHLLLGRLLIDGTGIARDRDRGLEEIRRAASAGNADALLEIARLAVAGEPVPGWTMSPEITTTLAFGTLVGKLDPEICNRLQRIAREFTNGEIVAPDFAMAERWYRLAADLGDAVAAWKVASMHLVSEVIEKDNETLIKYMTQAADGGVPAAQVELGKLHAEGALIEPDLVKAMDYLRLAAAAGNRSGLVQLAGMLEPGIDDPAVNAEFDDVLARIALFPDPPSWVFVKQARQALALEGTWGGEATAAVLLEQAVALDDPDAAQALAGLLLRHTDVVGNFERAVSLLNFAVLEGSAGDAMGDLRAAYLCRTPGAPDFEVADFWANSSSAAGNATIQITASELAALAAGADQQRIATLQTHALLGRPSAVASYRTFLADAGAGPEVLAFWDDRIASNLSTAATVLRRQLADDATPGLIDAALVSFGMMQEKGVKGAGLDVATLLIDRFPGDPALQEEGMRALVSAAQSGSGDAIWRLLAEKEPQGIGRAELYAELADGIDARGDSDAMLFAATAVADPAKRLSYMRQAVAVAPCTFDSAFTIAETYATIGAPDEAARWIEVALHMAEDNARRFTALGDVYAALPGIDFQSKAVALYVRGEDLGDGVAFDRLAKLYQDAALPTYSPTKAIALYRDAMADATVTELSGLLAKLPGAPPAIRSGVLKDFSIADAYRGRAETGDAEAMVALASYLQDTGVQADGSEAVTWLQKAAAVGETRAMVALAKAYALGVGVVPSLERSRALLEEAAAKGSNEARTLLANMT